MKKALFGFLFCAVWGLAAAASPRLLFTDANIAHLKNPAGVARAVELAERGKNNKMEAWSLAYRVTGDVKYAQKVKSMLLRECGDAPRNWGGGLGAAHKCYDMAIGFDSIRDMLTPEERRTIAANLVKRGIEPMLNEWLLGKSRTIALDSMGHNWWSSCVFLPGVAALAVADEEPRVNPWLERIALATREWVEYPGSLLSNKPATFDRMGGMYESVGYASYALSTYLTFRLAWKNARKTPLPETGLQDRFGDFFLNSCYPNSDAMMALNFGDSSIHAVGSQPLVLLWADGVRKPRYLWYLAQTADADYKEAIRRNSPLGLVFFPSEKELAAAPAEPDLPLTALYPDMGWAIMRDAWKPDATMLGVKSGFTWNHAHADAGSFILFHRGENLLIDSGNCWYPHPEYDAYYRQSRAHNVVLFDGEGENPEDSYHGSKFPGTVQYPVDAAGFKYVLADATGPTAQNFIRNYRSFLWIDDVILVVDDLKTYRTGQFDWLLHYEGEAKRKGLDLTVTRGKAKIAVRPLFPERFPEGFAHDAPERLRLEERSGLRDHQQKSPIPYFAIIPPEKARVMKFVTAILLNPDDPPQIERLEAVRAHGVRITRGNRTTEVWLNLQADGRMRHRNSDTEVGGYATDAYLLAATTEPGKPTRLFAANASFVRRGDHVLLDSLAKVFATHDGVKSTIHAAR